MSTEVYINLALQALRRSNPIQEIAQRIQAFVYTLFTHKSNVKLTKYRQSLYIQQLRRMEGFISQGSPYRYRGEKMDRRF